jgi:hypothetical protein
MQKLTAWKSHGVPPLPTPTLAGLFCPRQDGIVRW